MNISNSQALLIIGGIVITDQLSKATISSLKSSSNAAAGVYPWLNTAWLFNQINNPAVANAIAALIIGLLLYFLLYKVTSSRIMLALALIISGGSSNLIDRLLYGGVIDIFHTQGISLNSADIVIFLGVLLLLFPMWNRKGVDKAGK